VNASASSIVRASRYRAKSCVLLDRINVGGGKVCGQPTGTAPDLFAGKAALVAGPLNYLLSVLATPRSP
jgi:hypothetical protein